MISVIVSAYFGATWLKDCLKSLAAQTDSKFSILAAVQIDSLEHIILKSFPRPIKIFPTQNIPSLWHTWNFLTTAAPTPYIANLNSDDQFLSNTIEIYKKAILSHPKTAFFYSDFYQAEDNKPLKRIYNKYDPNTEPLSYSNFYGHFVLWKKSIHKLIGYYDETIFNFSDVDFWCRIKLAGLTFSRIPYPVGIYLKRPDSFERRNPADQQILKSIRARYTV